MPVVRGMHAHSWKVASPVHSIFGRPLKPRSLEGVITFCHTLDKSRVNTFGLDSYPGTVWYYIALLPGVQADGSRPFKLYERAATKM